MSAAAQHEELQRQQRNGTIHSRQIAQKAPNPLTPDGIHEKYLEMLTQSGLDQGTIRVLDNLLSQDWVLSNITEAELTEIKWLTRVTVKKVFAMHPSPDSVVTGARRAFLLDDVDETLEPLSQEQRIVIKNFIRGTFARAARGRDGWQQEQMGKSINVSEVRDQDSKSDSIVRGLFS